VRADAQRNYDRIVEVAREVFRERGADASLDEVAKRAGVGAGTLYRHFPTREDLYDAVMKEWVEGVRAMAEKAAASELPPRELLLSWFEQFVATISRSRGGPARLTAAMGDTASPMHGKCQALLGANATVLERLAAEGALRDGVDALQVSRLIGGVAAVADQGRLDSGAVRPMLEVVADGLLR
jgi:AcrR family transcriptional regulator